MSAGAVTPAAAGARNPGWLAALAGMAIVLAALLLAFPAPAQSFPPLTGRVVDQADLLRPEQEVDLASKLAALEAQSGRQLVVATVRSLEGRPIADYGYRLGRHWGIGSGDKDDGVILLVAPAEKQVRIETGYGARVFLTDAVASVIIRNAILPRFRQGDMAGGVTAGAGQIIALMQLPEEEARRRAAEIGASEQQRGSDPSPGLLPVLFWMLLFFFVVGSLAGRGKGRRYRRRGWGAPVILWGPGWGGGGSSGWGGGFGGGGGGFSGGGGSFGGGGASGSW